MSASRRELGVGLGLRAAHYAHILENRPAVPWFEAITENYLGIFPGDGGRPAEVLEGIRRDYPVVFHGVSLSIGSTDPLKVEYLKRIKQLFARFDPLWISDHLCWSGVGGENLHDLMPLPYTEEALEHVAERVQAVQEFLGRRLVLENVSSYFSYTHSTLTEWELLSELCRRTDCAILLDVNNVYVNSVNHGFDPARFLEGLPADSVAQMHLAGYSDEGSYLLDAHNGPVADPVWALYDLALARFGATPTLVEWDQRIPAFDVLDAERKKAQQALDRAVNGGGR